MFRGVHRVVPNPNLSVAGGWDVEVLWVFNDKSPRWEAELPPETRNMIGKGHLKKFPHYA